MPIYVFKCPACGRVVEAIRQYDDPTDYPMCMDCTTLHDDVIMEKQPTAPATHFRGEGWTKKFY